MQGATENYSISSFKKCYWISDRIEKNVHWISEFVRAKISDEKLFSL